MNLKYIKRIVKIALQEDVGDGDITSQLLIPSTSMASAVIIAKEPAILCGGSVVKEVFQQLDPSLKVSVKINDGTHVKTGDVIVFMSGKLRTILGGERVALNFISYLSGISTRTNQFCNEVKPYDVSILDTRKTTPGMRVLERYAVTTGGGVNHRFNLNDMVLVKDNHRVFVAGKKTLADAVKFVRSKTRKKIEVEVDSLEELKDVLAGSPDYILLDNMPVDVLKKAVNYTRQYCADKQKPLLEASGGVSLKTVKRIASTGVDRISIGGLTHSRQAVDMSLEVLNA